MPPTPPGVPPGLATWPGLDSGKTDVVVGDLRSLAHQLESYVESLLGDATGHLQKAGSASAGAYGAWDAAVQLAATGSAVQSGLVDHHVRFVQSLMDVVKLLYSTAQVYDVHEAAIEAKIRELGKRLDQTPSPGPDGTPPSPPAPQSGPQWPLSGGPK